MSNQQNKLDTRTARPQTLAGITKTRDKKFNIAVKPKNPAFALQLSYSVPEITKRINKYFGYDAVNKITFRK